MASIAIQDRCQTHILPVNCKSIDFWGFFRAKIKNKKQIPAIKISSNFFYQNRYVAGFMVWKGWEMWVASPLMNIELIKIRDVIRVTSSYDVIDVHNSSPR